MYSSFFLMMEMLFTRSNTYNNRLFRSHAPSALQINKQVESTTSQMGGNTARI
jgi:hypothetical protein